MPPLVRNCNRRAKVVSRGAVQDFKNREKFPNLSGKVGREEKRRKFGGNVQTTISTIDSSIELVEKKLHRGRVYTIIFLPRYSLVKKRKTCNRESRFRDNLMTNLNLFQNFLLTTS